LATRIELRTAENSDGAVNHQAPPALRLRRERSPAAVRGLIKPMRYRWYPPCKAVADRLLALVLLAVAAPVILVAAAVVRLTSRGPAFYTQTRVGRFGRPFTIYKLRTMINRAESLTGPRWSLPGDPRVTRFGALLRATHLDELPQLINVLLGHMSLIGPRPERPEFLPELEKELPGYRKRLSVRPGVTGLAQVQLPADSDVHTVRRKLAYDLFYIQRLSPWLDLRLLACTLLYALGVRFETIGRWFRIPRVDEVEKAMHAHIHEGGPGRPARRSA
jgi:lipopolysaccharide/colanic/teichoic acid biosynthesis glycosyltransferase